MLSVSIEHPATPEHRSFTDELQVQKRDVSRHGLNELIQFRPFGLELDVDLGLPPVIGCTVQTGDSFGEHPVISLELHEHSRRPLAKLIPLGDWSR